MTDFFNALSREAADEKRQFIIQLVLDSVFEVKYNDSFISGVDAVNKVLMPVSEQTALAAGDSGNLTQRLSTEAIDFAFKSALSNPRDISALLYNYNRLPITREWRRLFPDEEAVTRYLGLGDDGSWPNMPAEIKPRPVKPNPDGSISAFDQFWRYWTFREKEIAEESASYKVYVNTVPADLPKIFRAVREFAADSGAYSMKIGRNLTELLRSDKFIVYFAYYDDAVDFVDEFSHRIKDCRHQVVPFSHQPNPENPLVTIGVDPPKKMGERNSWRHYVTDKVAMAIQGAWRAGVENAIKHINSYLRVIGIDGVNWCPINRDWSLKFDIKEEEIGRAG